MQTGSVDFHGEHFSVSGEIARMTDTPPSVCVAALAPPYAAHGRITRRRHHNLDGRPPHTRHPRRPSGSRSAAEDAGRPAPRVCVGLPICVTDDTQAGFEAASGYFQRYGTLPSYRRMLDIEGVESPAEVAIIGNEAEVEDQLKALSSAGATDFLASIFPVGPDADASVARTRELLKSLAGRV